MLATVRWILEELLGWKTDEAKSSADNKNVVLGAHVAMMSDRVDLAIPQSKKSQWLRGLRQIWHDNWLHPGVASKLAGRLQWASCHVFNRCAKAALRPIIRRRSQRGPDFTLTKRLRQAICWFMQLLESQVSRSIPFHDLHKVFPTS